MSERILVCGSRNENDQRKINGWLDGLLGGRDVECVITGACRGADTLAGLWAEKRGLPVMEFPAPWNVNPKAAGPIRNAWMLKLGKPTRVVAFPGGTGTQDMMTKARRAGVPVTECRGPARATGEGEG